MSHFFHADSRIPRRHFIASTRWSIVALIFTFTFTMPVLASTPDLFGLSLARGDFDSDGFEDLAVGAPGQKNYGGGVEVYYGGPSSLSGPSQNWSQDSPGISGATENSDGFGETVATGDFNGDGYSDLAVGVPLEDLGSITDAGAVNVIYGSATGLTSAGNWLWHQDSAGISGASETGDRFGSALATGDFDNDGYDDLAIGVPREDLNSVTEAGMVNVIYGSATGLTSANNNIWHQDRNGILDQSEAGDEFGWALAAGDFDDDGFDDLAIGVPWESFENKGFDGVWAGLVNMLYGSSSGLDSPGNALWHLDLPLMLGNASFGDRYGTSLAAGDFNNDGTEDLAVGAPGEDISASGAGAVGILYFYGNAPGAYANQLWAQGWSLLQGTAVNSDGFGFRISVGDFNGDSRDDLAVGIPGKDINGTTSCGETQVIYGTNSGLSSANNQIWNQDSPGILDSCETSDQAGRAMGAGDFNNDGFAEMVIGIPQENGLAGLTNIIVGSSSGLTSAGNYVLP